VSILASIGGVASAAWPWFLFFAGLSALIILHEFGHFIVAKWTGMRVERFFLFFPPKLFSVMRGETEYGIGMIPLGGFVKITGMNPQELEPPSQADEPRQAGFLEKIESVDQDPGPDVSQPGETLSPELLERAYYNQPVWKRIVVIAAGPVMNILIAFIILFALSFSLQDPVGDGLKVSALQSDSPALGKLHSGDKIISVDGFTGQGLGIEDRAKGLSDRVNQHKCSGTPTDGCVATTPAQIVVQRGDKRLHFAITPKYHSDGQRMLIGYQQEPASFKDLNPSPPEAARIALDRMWYVTSQSVSRFARLFEASQRSQVSGIVGISDAGHKATQTGAFQALALLALISLSLAIVNLFPFLPLDGGHIFWSLFEKVRGRRPSLATIERASAVGVLLVLMLFVIGLSNDIGRLTR
jgi:regulator of sigma E protease